MRFKERRPAQKIIVPLLYGLNVATIVVAATDHRLGWSVDLPLLAVAGDLVVVAGFYLYFLVFRENSFAGSTIEISADQRVIATGPYAIVRHPLYVALVVTTLGMPLALGSYWATLLVVPTVALLVWRLPTRKPTSSKIFPDTQSTKSRFAGVCCRESFSRLTAECCRVCAAASRSRLSRSISSAVAMALRVLRASMTSST